MRAPHFSPSFLRSFCFLDVTTDCTPFNLCSFSLLFHSLVPKRLPNEVLIPSLPSCRVVETDAAPDTLMFLSNAHFFSTGSLLLSSTTTARGLHKKRDTTSHRIGKKFVLFCCKNNDVMRKRLEIYRLLCLVEKSDCCLCE